MAIRSFTSQLEDSAARSIDNDAPSKLRQEFIDVAFHVLEQAPGYSEARLHQIISQSLGIVPAGQPYGGFRYAVGRDVNRLEEWPRVYDLICRLWPMVPPDLRDEYRTGVNRILAGNRIVWDLGDDGQLHRVLPPAAHSQLEAAFLGCASTTPQDCPE
jgi:hypothetical protein